MNKIRYSIVDVESFVAGENEMKALNVTPCEVFSGNGKPGLPVKAAKCRDVSLN